MYLSKYMTPDSLEDVRRLARNARGWIDHIYLHWTAGWYGQCYDDYHICIDKGGEIYLMCDNSLIEIKAHTWRRNTGAVGIALCCCGDATARADATATNEGIKLGSEPPTAQQIEVMAEVVAVLADEFDLPLDTDEYVMTHYEAAKRDGYAPGQDPDCRWDLWYIPDYYGAEGRLDDGGALIRGKAAWYQRKWRGEFWGD
jgi:hypothetical protein